MRTLILTCNTGMGHNACAQAIKEVYDEKGEVCLIQDALGFISRRASKLVSTAHVMFYRYFPRSYGKGYARSEKNPEMFNENSLNYHMLAIGADRLYAFLCDGQFDSVISTHVFASLMFSEVQKRYPLSVRCGFVATDYTCSPGVKDILADFCFLPHEDLDADFASPAFPAEKRIACGIPIRKMFYERTPKEQAKKACGIDPGRKHLLVMCGSMGCGHLLSLTVRLAEKLKDTADISVVCGTNEKLYEALTEAEEKTKNVHILGYVKNVSQLMDSADVFLTKPGGISVTEAARKELPMVLIDAVAGCEEYNRRFFTERGMAVTATGTEALAKTCESLLADDTERNAMAERMRQFGQKRASAAEQIFDRMRGDSL